MSAPALTRAQPVLVGVFFLSVFLGSSVKSPSWLASSVVVVLLVSSYFHARSDLPLVFFWFMPFLMVLVFGALRSGANQGHALTVVAVFCYQGALSLAVSGASRRGRQRTAVLSSIAFAAVVMGIQIVLLAGSEKFIDAVVNQQVRLGWEVGQPNMAGQAAAVGAVIAVHNLQSFEHSAHRVQLRIIWGIAAVFLLAVAIGTQSRRAWLILVVALVVYSWLTRKIGMAISLGVAIAAFVSLSALSGNPERLQSLRAVFSGERDGMSGSDENRVDLVQAGWQTFLESPITGKGTGELRWANQDTFGQVVASHNNFVEILANNGLIGFIAFYAPLIWVWWILVKRALESARPSIALIAALLSADLIVSGGAAITYLDPLSIAVCAVAVAAAAETRASYVGLKSDVYRSGPYQSKYAVQ